MENTKKENATIKKTLRKAFPNYKISVRQDTGTACGWKKIKITTDIREVRNPNGYGLIPENMRVFNEISQKAEEIIRNNAQLGYYYGDMGGKYEQMIVSVSGIA